MTQEEIVEKFKEFECDEWIETESILTYKSEISILEFDKEDLMFRIYPLDGQGTRSLGVEELELVLEQLRLLKHSEKLEI